MTPEKRAAQEAQVAMARTGHFDEVVSAQTDNILALSGIPHTSKLASQIKAMAYEIGIEGFANQIQAQVYRPDSRPDLASIECPTLVLCGEYDQFCVPALHHKMAEKIPHSTFHTVKKCGHLSSMEQPEEVSTAMRTWLSS